MRGTWTHATGHKLHVWKVRVIEPTSELPAANALPGEVLAITGRGLWVQTGKGQVEIIEASFDEDPEMPADSLLRLVCGPTRMIL